MTMKNNVMPEGKTDMSRISWLEAMMSPHINIIKLMLYAGLRDPFDRL